MKKVIILRKGQVAMKTFAPPFFNHFSLSLSRKKNCGNEVVVCSQCFLRSSCLQIFFKRGVLKNFANFTGKHACIKKRSQHRYFPVKFAKFWRTIFFFRTPPAATSETKHMYASTVDLLHIRIVNLDWTESHEKEIKHIHDSAADLLHIRIENLD